MRDYPCIMHQSFIYHVCLNTELLLNLLCCQDFHWMDATQTPLKNETKKMLDRIDYSNNNPTVKFLMGISMHIQSPMT